VAETTTTVDLVATTTTAAKPVSAPKATTTTVDKTKSAVVASGEGWKLVRTSGSEECMEVVAATTERVCGIVRPAHVAGPLGVVPVPNGSLFAAVTTAEVTSADLAGTGGGPLVWGLGDLHPDPYLPGVQVLTHLATVGRVSEAWAIFRGGDDPLAMARFTAGRLGAPGTLVDATPTFGPRSNYRRVIIGLSWGIHEFGVYDGADGRPCLVFRRLVPQVGEAPATTGDDCLPATGRQTIEAARVLPTSNPEYFDVLAAFTPDIDGWRVAVPGGPSYPDGSSGGFVKPDPRDPTLHLPGFYGSVVIPTTAQTLTIIATTKGAEVARVEVPIPRP
jgi:hypothetical protein